MKPCAAREIEVDTRYHKHTFFLYLHLCRQRNERGTQQGIMYHPPWAADFLACARRNIGRVASWSTPRYEALTYGRSPERPLYAPTADIPRSPL
jgi:hypothetical protein